MTRLVPFGIAAGTSIDGLDVETDEDSLVLHGSLGITRDKAGLERLRRLSSILDDARAILEASELPDEAASIPEGPIGPNPFDA